MRQSVVRHWAGVWLVVALTLVVAVAGCAAPSQGAASVSSKPVPRYDHIFLIVMENHDYDAIIGSSDAPHLNALAKSYGLATNYWAVSHPSEPNYVAIVGGSTFAISDDASYTLHQIDSPYLGSQLEDAQLTWKSYQQGLPTAGYPGETATSADGAYASKHNPFLNFLAHYPDSQRPAEMRKSVPLSQLQTDLSAGSAPNLSFIVPGLCDDMHGDSACGSANLVRAGDTFAFGLVNQILASSVWSQGNTAIIITWDEGQIGLGSAPNSLTSTGGHVATIVVANHGPRGAQDSTAYNHYSLLLTIESAFGLGCVQQSCDSAHGVQTMAPLFSVTP